MTTTNTDTPAVELTREWVEWLIASRGASPDEFNCKLIAMARSWLARQDEGWQPIETCPVGELVLLANKDRYRSDDILGFIKDIGYLTVGGWFNTFGKDRAMTREAFTHWKRDAALSKEPK